MSEQDRQDNEKPQNGSSLLWETGSIIFSRVAMIGEGIAPRELFINLSVEGYHIFLTEPNPTRFPADMQALADLVIQYSSTEDWDEADDFWEEEDDEWDPGDEWEEDDEGDADDELALWQTG